MDSGTEIRFLRAELASQWESNHAEHCSSEWPHPEGKLCHWPPPEILARPGTLIPGTQYGRNWSVTGCLIENGTMLADDNDGHLYGFRVEPGGRIIAGQVHLNTGAIIQALPEGGFIVEEYNREPGKDAVTEHRGTGISREGRRHEY
jgi:hypothetical protein